MLTLLPTILAVTGLFLVFAVSIQSWIKHSADRTLAASEATLRTAIRGKHIVSTAPVSLPVFVKVENANRGIEHEAVTLANIGSVGWIFTGKEPGIILGTIEADGSTGSFEQTEAVSASRDVFRYFFSAVYREWCHFRLDLCSTALFVNDGRIVIKRVAHALDWNDLELGSCDKCPDGVIFSEVLNRDVHRSGTHVDFPLRDLAIDFADKLRASADHYLRAMLSLKVPFGLQGLPEGYPHVPHDTSSANPRKNYLYFANRTRGSPTSTKGFLFLLIGFVGSAAGFSWFFGLILWRIGSRWQTCGSLGLIVFAVVVFHIGICWLLT